MEVSLGRAKGENYVNGAGETAEHNKLHCVIWVRNSFNSICTTFPTAWNFLAAESLVRDGGRIEVESIKLLKFPNGCLAAQKILHPNPLN
jgi:hypothetical protein